MFGILKANVTKNLRINSKHQINIDSSQNLKNQRKGCTLKSRIKETGVSILGSKVPHKRNWIFDLSLKVSNILNFEKDHWYG